MTEIFIAFGAGLISFLSPCVLPLIPGYISYISGSTLENLLKSKNVNLLPIILFTLGFSVVFIIFGASATVLGKILLKNSFPLRIIAGLIIIIFSLHILGVFNLNFLNYEKRLDAEKNSNVFSSFLVGMAFAFGWTPCIGPILGSILILASTTESIYEGIMLLTFYSLGLAIPFILAGYAIQKFLLISKNIKQKMNIITKTGGVLLFLTGILIITNQLQAIGFYLLEYIPFLGKIG
jgi:cytochrome c-type biogenesis protein